MPLGRPVTRRDSVPSPTAVRQIRDDITVTPPLASTLALLVGIGIHLGVATLTLLRTHEKEGCR